MQIKFKKKTKDWKRGDTININKIVPCEGRPGEVIVTADSDPEFPYGRSLYLMRKNIQVIL